MFILKFALEVSLLVGLFFIFKRFVFKSLRIEEVESNSNELSMLNRAAYSFIFIVSGLVFSFITFWFIYLSFSVFHSLGHYSGVLVAEQMGLFVPSLIIGFYASTQASKSIYASIFGVKSLSMLPAYSAYSTASRKVFTRVFTAMSLLPALFLVALQFNVYLKIDGDKIYTRQMLQQEKVYALTDVVRVAADDKSDFSLLMNDGEVIAVTAYSGNVNAFLDQLKW